MAYSELIKNFANIRDYICQFYIYGFKSRKEYGDKSARSYDNERRRIESWLGEYMGFTQGSDGKNTFISVDSRKIAHNPLYKAFKAKTFTDRDIMLHFYILDILSENTALSSSEIADKISAEYITMFENIKECDESTIRKQLNEYEKLGLISSEKQGRKKLYKLCADNIDLQELYAAISFFGEADPLGVVGSYLLDKYSTDEQYFQFKHHYIMGALESEVLYNLFDAISKSAKCVIEMFSSKQQRLKKYTILPLKIYISTYNGRRYIMAWRYNYKEIAFYRLDKIKAVKNLDVENDTEKYRAYAAEQEKFLWGVSITDIHHTDLIEMTVRVEDGAEHIINRLNREKRNGKVRQLENGDWKYSAEVFDATEMVPWIRTFTGRIVSVKCTNKRVEETIRDDIRAMYEMYGIGGDDNDIQ